jgi:uncharacterized protein (DUF433 family)
VHQALQEDQMLTVCDHIEVDAKGVARIAGSRIKVSGLVRDARLYGWGVKELHEQFPHLTLAQLHAAFVYYHDHQEEVDRQIAAGEKLVEDIEGKLPPNKFTLEMLKARRKA